MYRKAYHEAIDTISEEVKRRLTNFDQSDIQLIQDIEILFLTSPNGTVTHTLSDALVRFFEGDILKVQLVTHAA